MKVALRNADIKKPVCALTGEEKRMALVLRGEEFIATEALSASTLCGLMGLARRRPLLINGLELHHQDLATLAEEVQRTGHPVWPGHRTEILPAKSQ